MRRLVTLAAVLLAVGAPAALLAQSAEKLSPADSALVERLTTQYKSATEAKDYVEAIRLAVRIGTVTRNGALLHKMGHYYEAGSQEIPKDDAEAVRVFTLASDLGDAESQHHIGLRHLEGRGVALDSSRGARLIEQSARGRYGPAMTEWRKLQAEQRRVAEASDAAMSCAKDELKRIGWFELRDMGDVFRGQAKFIRIYQKAPSMSELRGDVVTVTGPTYNDRTRRFALEDLYGFVGITEKTVEGTQLKTQSLDQLVTATRQGADEVERVRAACPVR
jgi:TPR repeat protein